MKKRLIGDTTTLVLFAWWVATTGFAVWLASQFASDSPCRIAESEAECHGRRTAEADPLILLLIFAGWIVVTFVLPRVFLRRRRRSR